MSSTKFSDDFKRDAVAQITERGYPVSEQSELKHADSKGSTSVRSQPFDDLHAMRIMVTGTDAWGGELPFAAVRANGGEAQEADLAAGTLVAAGLHGQREGHLAPIVPHEAVFPDQAYAKGCNPLEVER